MLRLAKTIAGDERIWNLRTWLALYLLVGTVGTITKLAPGNFIHLGVSYQPLQNFVLFRNAFFHLIQGKDIYAHFRLEQWDLYKYSPAFALFMAPLAILPYSLGALGWNLLNLLVLWLALRAVPAGDERRKALALAFLLLSALSNLQNAQSNTLVAALMLLGWTENERGRPCRAALAIALGTFIKPFALVALLPCVVRRRQLGALAAGMAGWSAGLALVPLLAVSPRQLVFLYQSWYRLLQNDQATHLGMSVMGLLKEGLGVPLAAPVILLAGGVALVAVPLLRWRAAGGEAEFRLLLMASGLVWVVMFNHMTESPSFVIAVSGIVLWYFFKPGDGASGLDLGLLAFAFVGTCLSSTSIVPHGLRHFLLPNFSKLLPCIPIWIKLQIDLWRVAPGARSGPGMAAD